MVTTRAEYEQLVLNEIQDVPVSELPKMIRLLHFFKKEFFESEYPGTYHSDSTLSDEQAQIANAVAVVRETWASIPLDKKTAIYIAEDKELEYDI